jgi:hypothetical protein
MVTIADFHKAFLEAEAEIKFAELFVSGLASVEDTDCVGACEPRGVVIPAINELRYAAKHISSAMQEDVAEDYRMEQLRRAVRHCIRARLDALRSIVLFLSRDFQQFSDDYRLLDIAEEDREQLNVHRKKIWDVLSKLSRDHSNSTSEDCEKLKASIDELHSVYLDVSKFRGKFNQVLSRIESKIESTVGKHDKTSTWQWQIGIIVAIILALIALFR